MNITKTDFYQKTSFLLPLCLFLWILVPAENLAIGLEPVGADCCDQGDKPQKITLTYTGDDCGATLTTQDEDKWNCSGDPNHTAQVYIVASDDDEPGEGDIWFSGNVGLNTTFEIDATQADEDDLSSRTYVYIYDNVGGTLLQSIEFHTSCSQPLSIDDQYGALALETILFKDGTLCGPPPCVVVAAGTICGDESNCGAFDPSVIIDCTDDPDIDDPTGTACCESGEKPRAITMRYTGEGCEATTTTQPSDKWSCSGNPNADNSVYIVASEKENPSGNDKIWFAGQVNLDGSYVIDAANEDEDKLKSNTWVNVYANQGGSLLQTINFHTSCSAPILLGDQYGANRLEEIIFEDGTLCSALPNVGGSGADCCDQGDKPSAITLTYTGEDCGVTATAQSPDKWSCTGDPANDNSVYIVASEKENPSGNDKIWFAGQVNLGETYVIDAANEGEDKLKSNTWIKIYANQGGALLQSSNFHTSCSQPLSADDQYGANRIESIAFEDGTVCGAAAPTIEYQWLVSTTTCPTDLSQAISNATAATYDPPPVNQTTYYVRLSRSVFCTEDTDWQASNCVVKEVTPSSGCDQAALSGLVFNDTNNDGIRNPNESGLPGVSVELQDCAGNTVATATTNSNGSYIFAGLDLGAYVVIFGPLSSDAAFSPPNQGNDEALDSDVNSDGATNCLTLVAGQQIDIDAGVYRSNADDPSVDGIYLEAECAIVGSKWLTLADEAASNELYVLPPGQNSLNAAPSSISDMVTFAFDLAEEGLYEVFGRTQTLDDQHDSFWVRSNGGTWQRWDDINAGNYGSTYQWAQVASWLGVNGSVPILFPLDAGPNTIDFAWREEGVRLDKIYLTKTGVPPANLGPEGCDDEAADEENAADTSEESPLDGRGRGMHLILYPVPTTGEITLEIANPADPDEIMVRIFDVKGQLVSQDVLSGSEKFTLFLSDLSNGTYLVQVVSGETVRSQRILLQGR